MIPVRVKRSLFVPPNRYGWTPWKRTILIRRDYPVSEREMAHELAHVLQWERYGAFFPLVYLWNWAAALFSYMRNDLEEEAWALADTQQMRSWAREVLKQLS